MESNSAASDNKAAQTGVPLQVMILAVFSEFSKGTPGCQELLRKVHSSAHVTVIWI